MKLRVMVCAAVALLAVLICAPTSREEGALAPAAVVYVIDGDTVIADTPERRNVRIRLIGINTPETVDREKGEEPYGREASNYTKDRLCGMEVLLEYDAQSFDRYGRDLCYIWIGGELFNETLVREGYATAYPFPPNDKYVDRFAAAERAAKRRGAGLWGL